MRPIWSGAISLVLVNIPVRLYSARQREELEFDLLHEPDGSRIRYAKMCKQEEREVPNEELVRGFEYRKGEYVVLTDEELRAADPKSTRTIEITSFVEEGEIDTIYFDQPYYLTPDKGAAKPFALLRAALTQTHKVAIGTLTLRTREHLVVLRPHEQGMVVQQLRYAHEVRAPEEVQLPEATLGPKELELATSLIEKLSAPFRPEAYQDTRRDTLLELIEKKAKGELITPVSVEPTPTRLEDLMEKLRQSLESGEKQAEKKKKAA